MIEGLTWLAVKAFFEKAWLFIKKYWQFFLGLSVGIVILLVSRDSGGIRKALEKFREADLKEREENLNIDKEKSERVSEAVDEYVEREKSISERQSEKKAEIENKEKEMKEALLSDASEDPASIANEINKELDKI